MAGAMGAPAGRGGAHSAPQGRGRSQGSVRAKTRGFLSSLWLRTRMSPTLSSWRALQEPSWSSPPRRESGWFWLVCLFFWGNFESQANTFILTLLQHWPVFTARQQHESARSHLSLSAVTPAPSPSAPLPRIRRAQSLRGRIIKPEAPR